MKKVTLEFDCSDRNAVKLERAWKNDYGMASVCSGVKKDLGVKNCSQCRDKLPNIHNACKSTPTPVSAISSIVAQGSNVDLKIKSSVRRHREAVKRFK